MRGERQLLRLGEYLVGRACRRLPRDVRQERYREWAAELPAILHDPQIRPAPRRAARMLGFAADTVRGTMRPGGARRRAPSATAVLKLFIVAGLVSVSLATWATVQAPGNGLNYVRLAWAVLVAAYPISELLHSARRVTALLIISGNLTGMALFLWNAAEAPGDWANYFWAATFLLLLPAWWLTGRWTRTRRA